MVHESVSTRILAYCGSVCVQIQPELEKSAAEIRTAGEEEYNLNLT